MRGGLATIILTVSLAASATRALAVVPHAVIGDPYEFCEIGVGDGTPLPDMGAVTSMPMTTSDGETGFKAECGVADIFFFGASFSQYFAAHAAATSIMVGKVGVLRGYGLAQAESFPQSYSPPGFVEATNNLSAYVTAGGGSFFVDVLTPPPTSTAPNPGDATELILTPVLDIDCAHYTNAFMQAAITVSFWTPAQYTDTSTDFVDPGFIFSTGRRAVGSGCPVVFDPPFTVTGLQVGQPVVMRVFLTLSPSMQLLASQVQFGSYYAEVSALNTATALVTTTDGNPVTGASGHTYVAVDPLPDLTVPTTTTTILPTPTTTTTLPGCGGMCGNGTLDASCGEACDCPSTADPVAAAYGCTGAAIIPPQDGCVICRGCQLLSFCVASTTTTAASTTTIPGGSTTTTSIPPCAGLAGVDRARCQLAAALAQPLCGSDVLPAAVDRAVRAKLQAANTALGSSTTATGKKGKKLRRRAVGALRAASARAAHAARTKNAAHHLSASCATTIANLTGELVQEIASP